MGVAVGARYLSDVEARPATGTLSLVGHGSLRIAEAGPRQGLLVPENVEAMAAMLDDALASGAAASPPG
jgi:N-acyl-D-aspartate/D-glutamate deacylase